jgi:hypothetical protein
MRKSTFGSKFRLSSGLFLSFLLTPINFLLITSSASLAAPQEKGAPERFSNHNSDKEKTAATTVVAVKEEVKKAGKETASKTGQQALNKEIIKKLAPIKPLDFKEYRKIVADTRPKSITLKKLKEELAKNKTLYLLDLRDEAQFKAGHLRGALNVGSDLNEEKLAKLVPSKEAWVVIYCTNSFIPTRMIALTHVGYPQLTTLGYKNVYRLEELWQGKDGFKEFDNLQKSPLWESSK